MATERVVLGKVAWPRRRVAVILWCELKTTAGLPDFTRLAGLLEKTISADRFANDESPHKHEPEHEFPVIGGKAKAVRKT